MTYGKIKNLERKSGPFKSRLKDENEKLKRSELPIIKTIQNIEDERKEIKEMIEAAKVVVEDLQKCNNNNVFVDKLKDDLF